MCANFLLSCPFQALECLSGSDAAPVFHGGATPSAGTVGWDSSSEVTLAVGCDTEEEAPDCIDIPKCIPTPGIKFGASAVSVEYATSAVDGSAGGGSEDILL